MSEPMERNKADQTLAPMSTVTGGRRIAQGIEITSREIVVVRLSCAVHGSEPGGDEGPDAQDRAHMPYGRYAAPDAAAMPALHVDDAVRHPLRPGIVVGADVLDADALASALAECLTRQAARLAQHGEHSINTLALGLCPSVVVQCEVPLETLMPDN